MKRGGQRTKAEVARGSADEPASLAGLLRPDLTARLGSERAERVLARVAALLGAELARVRADTGIRERPASADGWRDPPSDDEVRSPIMRDTLILADRFAVSGATVLLTGESGSGKERIARRIHERSNRAPGPFVAINCAAMPDTLIESELFGYVRGAFTGAGADREGLFESASGGTLLLDEIGETSTSLQAKLLRVIQESEVRRVGATTTVKVDVRIIAATNRDLSRSVARGEFREDLYYRLRVLALRVPPLRERVSDIRPLALEMLRRAGEEAGPMRRFSEEALQALEDHVWPGNVRELQNAVLRACVFSSGEEIGIADLPSEITSPRDS